MKPTYKSKEHESDDRKGSLADVLSNLRKQLRTEKGKARELSRTLNEFDFFKRAAIKRGDVDAATKWSLSCADGNKRLGEAGERIAKIENKIFTLEWIGPWKGLELHSRGSSVLHGTKRPNVDSAAESKQRSEYLKHKQLAEKTLVSSICAKIAKALNAECFNRLETLEAPQLSSKPALRFLDFSKLQLAVFDGLYAQCNEQYDSADRNFHELENRWTLLERLRLHVNEVYTLDADWLPFLRVLEELMLFIRSQINESKDALNASRNKLAKGIGKRQSFLINTVLPTAYRSTEKIISARFSVSELTEARTVTPIVDLIDSKIAAFNKANKQAEKMISRFEEQFERLSRLLRESELQTNKGLESVIQATSEFMQGEECLRIDISFARKRKIEFVLLEAVQHSEKIKKQMFLHCLKTIQLVAPVLHSSSKRLIDSLQDFNSGGDVRSQKRIEDTGNRLMMQILQNLDNAVTHEIWLLEDLQFWKDIDGRAISDKDIFDEIKNCRESEIEITEKYLRALKQTTISLQEDRDELEKAMIIAGIHENYHDKILKRNKQWMLKGEGDSEHVDISEFLAKIEGPLSRVTLLLKHFDTLLSESAPSSLDFDEIGRDECRAILTELFSAEHELRSEATGILIEESNNLLIWEKRVLVAEKVGDPYLTMRAIKRKEIHQAAVSFLLHECKVALPASFEEARKAVERVERILGLVPKSVLGENSFLFAFSLFDRILFLLENVQLMIDGEQAEPKPSASKSD